MYPWPKDVLSCASAEERCFLFTCRTFSVRESTRELFDKRAARGLPSLALTPLL